MTQDIKTQKVKYSPEVLVKIKLTGEVGRIECKSMAAHECYWVKVNDEEADRFLHISEIEPFVLPPIYTALFENSQTIRESTTKKEEGCHTITVIIRHLPGHSEPFVTHIHTLENHGYISGHYFETLKDAVQDYYERCEEEKVNPDPPSSF